MPDPSRPRHTPFSGLPRTRSARTPSHLQEQTIDDEIQLISDGDGLAIIGDSTAVDCFVALEGLDSAALRLPARGATIRYGALAAQTGSEVAANSGRWVKLTKESSQLVKKYGLRQSKKSGNSTGVVKGVKGQTRTFVEFTTTPGSFTNPALLASVGGIMAQLAMQQAIAEITTYLASIDAKVDDVLRAQKDTLLARMIGTGFIVEEAMTIREHGGRITGVTWSKVQAAPATIAEVQSYALRQIEALAEKMERSPRFGDLVDAAQAAQATVQEWLGVLARCLQLQDAIAVIELDRVSDASPEELDGHRLGLRATRQTRLELITRTTEQLLARLEETADAANRKVLLHPSRSRDVITASNQVALTVNSFHGLLGVGNDHTDVQARPWTRAAADAGTRVLETGAVGVEAARRQGALGLQRARHTTGKVARRVAGQASRTGHDDPDA